MPRSDTIDIDPSLSEEELTEQAYEAMFQEERRWQRAQVFKALRLSVVRWCREDYERRPLPSRVLYVIKFWICVLLWRRGSFTYSDGTVCIAETHYADLYAGWENTVVVVCEGVFLGWAFEVQKDGDWLM